MPFGPLILLSLQQSPPCWPCPWVLFLFFSRLFLHLGKSVICLQLVDCGSRDTVWFLRLCHNRKCSSASMAGTHSRWSPTHRVTVSTGHKERPQVGAPAEGPAETPGHRWPRLPGVNKNASRDFFPQLWIHPAFESSSWEPAHQRAEKSHSHTV